MALKKLAVTAALTLAALPVSAEDQALSIELNAAAQEDAGCRLSFLAENTMGQDIAQLAIEAVLFDTAGQVSQLTLFDLGALPNGRPRVRQFIVPKAQCDGLSRLLVNGLSACEGTGLSPAKCTEALKLKTRTKIEVIG